MINSPEETVRFYLIRHGETADNRQMRYLGTRDEPLTENGIQQAQRVADALAQLPIRIVISSPMRRTTETATLIQKACGVELRLDSRLAEGSFGSWEGLTRAEVVGRGGKDAEQLARWESDSSFSPSGGESLESVQKRVVSASEELKREFTDSSIVLVSHVGPIKALLASVLRLSLQDCRRLFLDPGTITVVDWGETPLLRLFNSHAHLGWSSARWMKRQSPVASSQ
jgi:broad specificity phosphatase PhoE